MPCFTVQTCTVNLADADLDMLTEAMKKLGWTVTRSDKTLRFTKGSVTGTYSNGKLNFSGDGAYNIDSNIIKKAYSTECVEKRTLELRKKGWEKKREGDEWVMRRVQKVTA